MQRLKCFHATGALAIVFALALTANPAFAHHPLGGETPATIWAGLLSGIGHPVIGIDHLAFVLAAGIFAGQYAIRRGAMRQGSVRWHVVMPPAVFVIGTGCGALLHVGGATAGFHFHDLLIALSVMALGGIVMLRRNPSAFFMCAGFGFAGIAHGHAYGEAVLGAEATPILAYIAGFGATQMVLALCAAWATMFCMRRRSYGIAPQMMGGIIAGIGFAYFAEIAEAAIFPVI